MKFLCHEKSFFVFNPATNKRAEYRPDMILEHVVGISTVFVHCEVKTAGASAKRKRAQLRAQCERAQGLLRREPGKRCFLGVLEEGMRMSVVVCLGNYNQEIKRQVESALLEARSRVRRGRGNRTSKG